MEYFILWLCSICSVLSVTFGWFTAISLVIGVIVFILKLVELNNGYDSVDELECARVFLKYTGGFLKYIILGGIFWIMAVSIPSTKDAYAIFGVGATLNYLNNSSEAQKIPDNALKAVNYYLESIIPEKNDSTKITN